MNKAEAVLKYLRLKEASKRIVEEMSRLDKEFGAHEEEMGDIKLTVHVHGIYIERRSVGCGVYMSWENLRDVLDSVVKILGEDIFRRRLENDSKGE